MKDGNQITNAGNVVRYGLSQMTTEALQRVVDHIDAGKPVYLGGGFYDDESGWT